MNNSRRQIRFGAVLSYLSIFLSIAAGLIYTPWMIQIIGKSQYGLYTLAYSLISLFLIDFGLSSATARYVSKYHSEGNEQKVSGFLGVVYKLYLMIDAVIFITLLIVFCFIGKIYINLTPDELEQFKVVYAIAGMFSVLSFPFTTLNGILTAYEEFIHQKFADVLYRVLLVSIMIVALLMGKGLYTLVAVNAIVGLIIIVYKLVIIKIKVPVKINFFYKDTALYKDIFGFSMWSTISSLAQRLVFSITPTVLGIVVNSSAIAVFGVVSTIEGYVFTVTTAINEMFMPTVSRAYGRENPEKELLPLLIKVGKFQYAINGLIVAGFFVVGKSFIELWMGPGYEDAYLGILLVIIPGLFYNSLQIANTALIVTNKVKYQAYVSIVTGCMNIILSFILSKLLGVIGACVSIFAAYMVRNVILNFVYYRVLKLNILQFIKECYIKMLIPIIISVLIGIMIDNSFSIGGWFDLIIKGMAVVLVFAITLLVFGVNPKERTAIWNYLAKIKK